jgi:hypothetical protein
MKHPFLSRLHRFVFGKYRLDQSVRTRQGRALRDTEDNQGIQFCEVLSVRKVEESAAAQSGAGNFLRISERFPQRKEGNGHKTPPDITRKKTCVYLSLKPNKTHFWQFHGRRHKLLLGSVVEYFSKYVDWL